MHICAFKQNRPDVWIFLAHFESRFYMVAACAFDIQLAAVFSDRLSEMFGVFHPAYDFGDILYSRPEKMALSERCAVEGHYPYFAV